MDKKVSIITTTYKHQDFITQTIESILSQKYKNRELLIGDDSPDNATWSIIQSYVKRYPKKIRAWHHSPNKGIVDNTNFLLSQTNPKSEYIAFLEGDDLYTPDNLSKKLKIFTYYPEVKLVYNELDFVDATGKILISQYLHYRKIPFFQNTRIPEDIFIKQTTGPIICRTTGMIHRSVLSICKVRSLDEKKKNYQVSDYDFYFQVATQYPVYGIQESLSKYRRHENNLSGAGGGTSEDLEKLIYYYYNNKFISKYSYRDKMSWIQIVYAFFFFEVGDKKKGLGSIEKSNKFGKKNYLIYKIFLLCIYGLPTFIGKKIIKKLVGRN